MIKRHLFLIGSISATIVIGISTYAYKKYLFERDSYVAFRELSETHAELRRTTTASELKNYFALHKRNSKTTLIEYPGTQSDVIAGKVYSRPLQFGLLTRIYEFSVRCPTEDLCVFGEIVESDANLLNGF